MPISRKIRTANEHAVVVRSILDSRGWTVKDLADAVGLGFDAVRFQLYRCQNSPRRAWRIERVLGVPIWTSAERYREFTEATEFLGADFVLTSIPELQRRARERGVPGASYATNKPTLLAIVLLARGEKLAAAPSHEKTID